jgi:tetratricopeptide (TPR) repeat protein
MLKNMRKSEDVVQVMIVLAVLLAVSGCRKQTDENSRGVDVGDAKAAAEKTLEADKLYVEREDMGKLRQAIALLRQARLEDYGSFEAAWKLARSDYYLGDHTTDEHEREAAFREGVEAGTAALRLQDKKPEGHFWLGANYGGSAKYSTLANLSTVEDIRREMETVLKIDEGFQAGSAYLVLGQLYLEAPKMLGGDQQKAIGYLEKGLRFGPNNGLLRLRLAEAYHAANRDGDALKEIDQILNMKPDPDYQPEYKDAVRKSAKLRAELKH